MKNSILASKIVFNVFVALLGILLMASSFLLQSVNSVSAFFGIDTWELVQLDENDETDTEYFKSDYPTIAALKEDANAVCAQVEAEGAVLLKNDNEALPLKSNAYINLFGVTSTDPVFGGLGSGSVDTSRAKDFKTVLGEVNINVNETLWNWYKSSGRKRTNMTAWPQSAQTIGDNTWSELPETKNDTADAAVYMIGRVGGEAADMKMRGFSNSPDSTNGNYLELSPREITVLQGLKAAKDAGKYSKIIVIINSANQIESNFIDNVSYGIDSVLWIGGVGTNGLAGVAQILSGQVNPSGRLSDAYWNKHHFNPVHSNFGVYTFDSADGRGATFNSYVVYQEGIYVGYRYAETRYEDIVMGTANAGTFDYNEAISHPFGYGLSYTTFSYSNYTVTRNAVNKTYKINVDVKNTGSKAGKEVVQVYVQKPYTQYDINNNIEKSAVDLIGFGKTEIIPAGETRPLTINVEEKFFAAYDSYGAMTYVMDEGDYYLALGKNSHDAVNNILAAKDYTRASTNNRMDTNGNSALVKKLPMTFDKVTYSKSDATGNTIKNLFDFADINLYEGRGNNSVRYMTRNNWANTVKFGLSTTNANLNNQVLLTKTKEMNEDQNLTIGGVPFDEGYIIEPDDIAYPTYGSTETSLQLIELGLKKPDGSMLYPITDPIWDDIMDQLTWQEQLDFLMNGYRRTSPIASIGKPGTVDGNGPAGVAARYNEISYGLGNKLNDPNKGTERAMCFPCNGIIGATFNAELAYRVGEMIGEDALWAGYSGIYGTGANIHRSPYEGRVFEYYSEDPILTGYMVSDESAGIQSRGCAVYNKHIALNEQEERRFGICTFTNEQAMREIYLRAFELPITEGGARNVMTALNRIGVIWASACKELCTYYLRDEIGMTGICVTDWYSDNSYMKMDAVILAGNDLPDGAWNDSQFSLSKSELEKYKPGNPGGNFGTMGWAMRDAVKRTLFMVVQGNGMNGISASTRVVEITPYWILIVYGVDIGVGVIAGIALVTMVTLKCIQFSKRRQLAQEDQK